MRRAGGHGRRGGHEEEHEEHENHERWLVSYADMMTLLMVLFIVMFAISSINQGKFDQLKEGLHKGFGAPQTMLAGGQDILDSGGGVAPDAAHRSTAPPRAAAAARQPWNTWTQELGQVAGLASATQQAQVRRRSRTSRRPRRR